jgi:hypothetical protein
MQLGRFWTQYEAWLSMQVVDGTSVRPANPEERRCTIATIANANSIIAEGLYAMWVAKTPEQAYDMLSKDDVTVTNQNDKDTQLRKLRERCVGEEFGVMSDHAGTRYSI